MQQPPPPQQPIQQYQPPVGAQQTNGMAVAALVSGILGLTIFFGLGSILALVFGYIARGQIKRSQGQQSGNGMAIAGLVMGWIGVVVSIVFIVLIAVGVIAAFNFATSDEFHDLTSDEIHDLLEEGVRRLPVEPPKKTTEEEARCTGIETYPDLGVEHVSPGEPHEPYNSNPPTSGPHFEIPAETGFYSAYPEDVSDPDALVAPERLVHNLEHGQIVIWYRPYSDSVSEHHLQQVAEQEPHATVVSPYFAGMNEPYNVVLTAWTKARACERLSQDVVDDFRRKFQGVTGPEPLTPPFEE